MRAWLRSLRRALERERGLLWLLAGVMLAGPLVPNSNPLARADLVPWLTAMVTLVAVVRGGPLGPGPHPALDARQSWLGAQLRRIGLGLVPLALFGAYELGRGAGPEMGALGLAAAVLAAVAITLGRGHGMTAWAPPGVGSFTIWTGVGTLIVVAVVAVAWIGRGLPFVEGSGLPGAVLLGLQFASVGLAAGRTLHLRQRLAAGRRDARSVWPLTFSQVLALVGPGVGWLALSWSVELTSGRALSFADAYVAPAFVFAWAAILWRPPLPQAIGCLWHEVLPVGGKDVAPDDAAAGFDRPPAGALRFSPLRLQRAQVVHPWIVPVRRARIDDLDDPVSPLWEDPLPCPPSQALGEAAFEPDPRTGAPQWEVVTVRLGARADTMALSDQDAQARRAVILRAYPRLGSSGQRLRTYRWDRRVPAESIQVLDATLDTCTLMDGDVLVLSTEGVARAYELEIGAPVGPFGRRPPQVEDYAEVK